MGKLLSWALLLALSFTGALLGLRAVNSLPYLEYEPQGSGWQDSAAFGHLLAAREREIARFWAGRLALEGDALTYLERQQVQAEQKDFEAAADPAATNFRFLLKNEGGALLLDNLAAGETLAQAVGLVYYASLSAGADGAVSFEGYEYDWSSGASEGGSEAYIIECGVLRQPLEAADDEFSQLYRLTAETSAKFSPRIIAAAACGVLTLVCLGYVLWTAGHKNGVGEIVLTWQEKMFFDLYLFAALCADTLLFTWGLYLEEDLYYAYYYGTGGSLSDLLTAGVAVLAAAFVGVLALTLRTLAVRCKAGTLAKTTLICRIFGWCWRAARGFFLDLPLTWRVLAGFLLYFFLNILLFDGAQYSGAAALLWCGLNIAALLLLCWWTACFRRLRKGSRAIAAGNLNYRIDTHRMPHDLRCHAEDLNNISVGLSGAVDEKMKSERFKAELITNVSHDLKTPLTSILNYVNLLKTTDQTDPKAVEYIEVLDRKSLRLKKLTEDLVEASKASTGALSVQREKIGLAQLIDQALGEWKEKLEGRRLSVVTALPEGETWVYADGRHLWRVIDNLLSNCAKYAMEGTRVYLDLTRGHGQITLSVKNISREALNIPPERLMERFVRGEESRSTEGSGLGLSIARSLTELQGGEFQLTVDGDLFKVSVTLPQAG